MIVKEQVSLRIHMKLYTFRIIALKTLYHFGCNINIFS